MSMVNPQINKPQIEASFLSVDGKDMIKIRFLLTPGDYMVRAIESADIEKYSNEWKAYTAIRPKAEMTGTRLSTVPGITEDIAALLGLKGVSSAEALAGLDDYAAHHLDNARGVTWRDTAKLVVASKAAVPAKSTLTAPEAQRKAA